MSNKRAGLTQTGNIGFVGMGAMGAPMAARLLRAGYAVAVWNRDASKAAPVVNAGARLASSPRDLAQSSDIVVSVLFDDAAVESVFLGEQGAAAHMPAGAIHLSCSTISPDLSERLEAEHAAAGQSLVCAPLLGGTAMATDGSLNLAASGPAAAVARLRPLFEVFAKRTMILGERPRDAVVAKLANNYLLFTVTQTIGEALTLAEKSGLSRGALTDMLWQTDLGRRIFTIYGEKLRDHRFTPATAPTELALKDMGLALAAADLAGVSMPLGELARDRLEQTVARGWGDLDFAAVVLLAEAESGMATGHDHGGSDQGSAGERRADPELPEDIKAETSSP